MNPPRIVSVEGHAFGSFASGFKLNLPATGLVLLRGENLDTRGSSASGKSTLIHAINYGHGTCPVPLTALQSWYTKDSPKVVETYDFDGKIVEVSRGKKFSLKIDGTPFPGGADQKEEKLDQLFGINADMRLALTYRGQRKPGLFLSKKDTQKKEFLTKLLGLDRWEEENKKAGARVKTLEDRVLTANALLSDAAARLEALRAVPDGDVEARLAQVKQDIAAHEAQQLKYEATAKGMRSDAEIVYDFALGLFKDQVDAAKARIAELEKFDGVPDAVDGPELVKLRQLQSTIRERIQRLEKEDQEKGRALLMEANALRSEWQQLALRAQAGNKLNADKDRVVADMQELAKDVCPTCKREWEEAVKALEDLKVELEQINAELEEIRDIKQEAARLKEEYDALPKEVEVNPLIAKMRMALEKTAHDILAEEARQKAVLREQIDEHSRSWREAHAALDAINAKAQAAATEQRSKCLAGIDGVEFLARQERDTVVGLDLERQRLAEQVGAVKERRRQITELEKNVAALAAEAEPLQASLNAERDFMHLTGREGFRGSIFDEVLEAISAETNEMLASIANTRNCTLEFKSDRETQEGKLRQEIIPVVTVNGHEAVLGLQTSGGMTSAIEIAVDLAVGKVISERTGVCPGWLILDESFDGLGPVEKETCLEILTRYASDRLVIVVDHMSETQGLFTHRITVQSQNGVSQLRA